MEPNETLIGWCEETTRRPKLRNAPRKGVKGEGEKETWVDKEGEGKKIKELKLELSLPGSLKFCPTIPVTVRKRNAVKETKKYTRSGKRGYKATEN